MDYEGLFSDISTVPAPEASKGRAEPRHIDIRNSRSSLRGRDEHKTKGFNWLRVPTGQASDSPFRCARFLAGVPPSS